MALRHVQVVGSPAGSGGGSITITGVTAGNLLAVSAHSNTTTVSGVTITIGSTSYSPLGAIAHPSQNFCILLWAIIAPSSGSITITTTLGGSRVQMMVDEWSGVYGTITVDGSSVSGYGVGNANNTQTMATAALTTTTTDLILIAGAGYQTAGVFNNSGQSTVTGISQQYGPSGCSAYIATGAGACVPSVVTYFTDYWIIVAVAVQVPVVTTYNRLTQFSEIVIASGSPTNRLSSISMIVVADAAPQIAGGALQMFVLP